MRLPFLRVALPLLVPAALCAQQIPRMPDGKPNLQGIWQVRSRASYDLQDHVAKDGMPAGKGVVEGGAIPYTAAAAAKKIANFKDRERLDPLRKCYLPGVPRIMYMEWPFQIFQTPEHVAMTFEWSQVHRLIYTNGKPGLHPFESWMGDARGKWEGNTLVVTVTDHNGKTWFDMAGNHHSDKLKVTERYTMLDADTIQYEATMEDPQTFTKPWKIAMPMYRQKNMDRLMEYQCQAEKEEMSGLFERDPRTWYPDPGAPPSPVTPTANMPASAQLPAAPPVGADVKRAANGKPDLTGYWMANAGGANYGLEKHASDFLTPGTRGVVIDPPDGVLPTQAWTRAERVDREKPYRGYDDPTAHCFVAGVPRSMYVPSPHQIIQTPEYLVILFERMSWRIIPLDGRPHIADNLRLWQGDSVGHWEGDVLVVDTANLNGKTWLNEVGEVVSHAEHVKEYFIPVSATRIMYRATVTDPVAYTKPWTIEMAINKDNEELLEVACHEDNVDLQHLKDVRDEHRAQQTKGN